MTLPRAERSEPAVLSRPQIDQLLRSIEGTRWYALFWTVAHTGLRVGEALALQWSDVDWDEPALTVRRALKVVKGQPPTVGDVKDHEARVVYLRPEDVAVLRAHRRRQQELRLKAGQWLHPELVFSRPQDGGYLDPTTCSHTLRKACRRIGLPEASMHDLRHSHGSILLAEGWDLAAVSRRLGHASIAFTAQVYMHQLPNAQKEYIQRSAGDRVAAQLPPMGGH